MKSNTPPFKKENCRGIITCDHRLLDNEGNTKTINPVILKALDHINKVVILSELENMKKFGKK